MKTTKTYAELKRFVGLASAYLSTQPTENALAYALRRTMRRIESAVKPVEEEIGDKKVELASLDDKKNLVFDARGNYSFTRENYTAFTKFMRDLDARSMEVEVYICNPAKVPGDIQPIFREEFTECGVLSAECGVGNGTAEPRLGNGNNGTNVLLAALPALEKEANLLCLAVEEMPASEQQTRLSIQASALATNLRLLAEKAESKEQKAEI